MAEERQYSYDEIVSIIDKLRPETTIRLVNYLAGWFSVPSDDEQNFLSAANFFFSYGRSKEEAESILKEINLQRTTTSRSKERRTLKMASTIDIDSLVQEFIPMTEDKIRCAFFFLFDYIESSNPKALQATLNHVRQFYPKEDIENA